MPRASLFSSAGGTGGVSVYAVRVQYPVFLTEWGSTEAGYFVRMTLCPVRVAAHLSFFSALPPPAFWW